MSTTSNSSIASRLGFFARKFMCRQDGKDDDWSTKAIEAIIKKLKKNKDGFVELQKALTDIQSPSKCVALARTLDGRIQVNHKKYLPHVIACKLWRWPDLENHHELKALSCCSCPYSSKVKEVCINPYHYQKVVNTVHQPDLVPISNGHSMPGSHQYNKEPLYQYAIHHGIPGNQSQYGLHHHNGQIDPYRLQGDSPPPPYFNNNNHNNYSNMNNNNNHNNYNNMNNHNNYNNNINQNILHNNNHLNNNYNHNNNNHIHHPISPLSHVSSDEGMVIQGSPIEPHIFYGNPVAMETNRQQSNAVVGVVGPTMVNGVWQQNYQCKGFNNANNLEVEYWCSINYYELNKKVGGGFFASTTFVTVDGYTDPSNNASRFCLGPLSNIHRNSTIEKARNYIGKGLNLRYDNGDVYVKCLSSKCIFVESQLYNYMNNLHLNAVNKIETDQEVGIFSKRRFMELLGQMATKGYDSVFELTKMCSVKISFVKGWGANYNRFEVNSTPCWVDITLNDPMQWMDRILASMDSPPNPISSVS